MLAAILWGCIGIFTKTMGELGFTAFELCFIRSIVTVMVIGCFYGIVDRSIFKLEQIIDLKYFVGSGILSFSFFNFCYITSIGYSSMGVAAILLYTAPAIIMILSRFLFKEKITPRKAIALLATFLGCVLVSGITKGQSQQGYSVVGILFGLCAGFGYALYSIFGKYALRKYRAMTLVFYTFVMSTLFFSCFVNPIALMNKLIETNMVWYGLVFALLSAVIPYIAYTEGLVHMEASKASIIATLEPIVAIVSGVLVFRESVDVIQLIGICMVLIAIMIIK